MAANVSDILYLAFNVIVKYFLCQNMCVLGGGVKELVPMLKYEWRSESCSTSLSAQSWQYHDRKKPEIGTICGLQSSNNCKILREFKTVNDSKMGI